MRSTKWLPTELRPVCLLAALVPFATGSAQAAPATGESAPPQQVGQPATDLQGIDASGSAIRLSQFKGKVILLDISAMWCFYCQQDAPAVQYLYKTYGPKGLVAVTCQSEDANGAQVTEAGLKQWASEYSLTLPVMNDQSGTSSGAAESAYVSVTGGFPTLVIIDRNFKVQYIQGGLDQAAVTAKIQALLAH